MNLDLTISEKLEGRYSLHVLRNVGTPEERLEVIEDIPNRILDVYYDKINRSLGTNVISQLRLCLGTGTSEPTGSETALTNETPTNTLNTWKSVDIPTSSLYAGVEDNYSISRTYTWNFNSGQFIGNFTEIGVRCSNDTSGSGVPGWPLEGGAAPLVARSLIKNSSGQPTTLALTANDQLSVVYTFKHYSYFEDTPAGSITIGAVSTGITVRCHVQRTNPDRSADGGHGGFVSGYGVATATLANLRPQGPLLTAVSSGSLPYPSFCNVLGVISNHQMTYDSVTDSMVATWSWPAGTPSAAMGVTGLFVLIGRFWSKFNVFLEFDDTITKPTTQGWTITLKIRTQKA
jgi:hypothetical protein